MVLKILLINSPSNSGSPTFMFKLVIEPILKAHSEFIILTL